MRVSSHSQSHAGAGIAFGSTDMPEQEEVSVWVKRIKRGLFIASFAVLAALVGTMSLTFALTVVNEWPFCGLRICGNLEPYGPVLMFAAVVRATLFVVGRPQRNRRVRGQWDEAIDGFREAAFGSLLLVLFTFFWRGGTRFRAFSYSRSVLLLDWLFATAGLIILLLLAKSALSMVRARGHNLRTVVIVGSSAEASRFGDELDAHPETGFRVIATLPVAARGDSSWMESLVGLVKETHVDEVVLATSGIGRTQLSQLVSYPQLRRVQVRAVPDLFGLPPTKVSLETISDFPLLTLLSEPLPGSRRIVKRVIDIVVAAVALLLASPVLLITSLAVKITSSGPTFFKQERVGMDGRRFQMIKLRTMYTDADQTIHQRYVKTLIEGEVASAADQPRETFYKLVDDPRVTPVGRWLRRFSLDELPQLVNVLRGEMSMVGPRPALPYEVAIYQDWHARRLDVRPGITGLWQVSGRSRTTFDEMAILDIQYIETWSPLLDLVILLRTVPALFRREAT